VRNHIVREPGSASKQIAAKGKINEVNGLKLNDLESGEKLIIFHNLHEIGDPDKKSCFQVLYLWTNVI
jgi:hypothetical protein